MRKNAPRKWLHAILDLLPVILIPVFMIYSHRHTIDSFSLQVEENEIVDIEQFVLNGKPQGWSDINFESGKSRYYEDGNCYYSFDSDDILTVDYALDFNFNNNDVIYLSFSCFDTYANEPSDFHNSEVSLYLYDEEFTYEYEIFVGNLDIVDNMSFVFNLQSSPYSFFELVGTNDTYEVTIVFNNLMLFDLTTIFGSGNEPTKEVFESMLKQDYYSYGVHTLISGRKVNVTYNDTDILSQFTYNLYNSVDKYFNMNNIFGFNNLYDWFVLNVFNGNAPLYVYIVWNIILYEFIMDLLFLLYAVFMFLIDVCTHLIEKVFDSGRGA